MLKHICKQFQSRFDVVLNLPWPMPPPGLVLEEEWCSSLLELFELEWCSSCRGVTFVRSASDYLRLGTSQLRSLGTVRSSRSPSKTEGALHLQGLRHLSFKITAAQRGTWQIGGMTYKPLKSELALRKNTPSCLRDCPNMSYARVYRCAFSRSKTLKSRHKIENKAQG